jgi:hypothetical protein
MALSTQQQSQPNTGELLHAVSSLDSSAAQQSCAYIQQEKCFLIPHFWSVRLMILMALVLRPCCGCACKYTASVSKREHRGIGCCCYSSHCLTGRPAKSTRKVQVSRTPL